MNTTARIGNNFIARRLLIDRITASLTGRVQEGMARVVAGGEGASSWGIYGRMLPAGVVRVLCMR